MPPLTGTHYTVILLQLCLSEVFILQWKFCYLQHTGSSATLLTCRQDAISLQKLNLRFQKNPPVLGVKGADNGFLLLLVFKQAIVNFASKSITYVAMFLLIAKYYFYSILC